jgi:protein-disulfide isomerase
MNKELDEILTSKLGFVDADLLAISSCVQNKPRRPFQPVKEEALRNGIGVTPGIVIGKFVNKDLVRGISVVELKELADYEALIKKVSTKEAVDKELRSEVVTTGFPMIGSPLPGQLAIVEYCDLNCATCGKLHDRVIPELVSQYTLTGQATYVFKTLPLEVNGEVATIIGKTAMCIKERYSDDMFFNFSDEVYNLLKQKLHY